MMQVVTFCILAGKRVTINPYQMVDDKNKGRHNRVYLLNALIVVVTLLQWDWPKLGQRDRMKKQKNLIYLTFHIYVDDLI